MSEAYIIDAVRTPRGRRKGSFSNLHAVDLLTYPLKAIVERNSLDPKYIEDLFLGCVTQTDEQGWCVARKGILASGWPESVPGITINRVCGSGQQALNFATMGVKSGELDLVIAGGLEHMTRVKMFSDCGGEDSPMLVKHYPDLIPQGLSAELLAKTYEISRERLDQFSYNSHKLASTAEDEGRFSKSLVPVDFTDDEGNWGKLIQDETIRRQTSVEKLATLKTVFKDDGVVTAGNASQISDGAGVLLIASESAIKQHNLKPRARVIATQAVGSPPKIMLTGPIEASKLILKKANIKLDEIDLWEINEAFSPVPLVVIDELGIDPARVNVNGGAIALGHPLGATGAMLLGTILDELERTNKRYGLVTMCTGLGMATATIIERLSR